ncbi:competence protein ComK [Sporosarcina sp. FSL W8-0480]|uniref:competence protein ComK n=1 Tax=Sporosarcina sp. FSL W8-0480 TaxID=2954701 RepID=UPI0030D7BF0D
MKDDSFLLDSRALALKPYFSEKYLSKIITTHGIYYSSLNPKELLDKACLRHYSSKAGRKEAARKLLKFNRKTPFLISDEVGVFPTKSSKHDDCIYIFSHFFQTEPIDSKNTLITFNNDISIKVSVSPYTVRQQKSRLHMLLSHVQLSKRQYIITPV